MQQRQDIDAIDRLADLVAKSLVVADVSGANPRFRLLDTTRAYAIEKLESSGERERSRAATPSTTAVCSNAPQVKRWRALQISGWPTTPRKSTMCAPRSTGPFRPTAMDRSGWR